MENIALEVTNIVKCKNPTVSGGYILTEAGVRHQNGLVKVSEAVPEETGVIAFYAETGGNEFKTVHRSGRIYRALKNKSYVWEAVGEMEETTILGAFFNKDNGNLLIVTETEMFLIDREMELVKQAGFKDAAIEAIRQSQVTTVHAEWSLDGKYILVLANSLLCIFRYDLSEIADTHSISNKVMNSRLVRTKKYLMHESAYVDIVRRVPMPDDEKTYVEDTRARESVLFETRSNYKLAAWHNRFSLVYAVSDENIIHVLERNALKFKEVHHVRKCDQTKEQISENRVVAIGSQTDYLYLIHQEHSRMFFKVYYIKNNCIYLKGNLDLNSVFGTESLGGSASIVPDHSRAPLQTGTCIQIVTEAGVLVVSQKTMVNRTDTDVVDVDGCRLIFYNLAKCCIPPPLFSRFLSLDSMPARISCFAGRIECALPGGLATIPSGKGSDGTESLGRSLEGLSVKHTAPQTVPQTEIPDAVEDCAIVLGQSRGTITLAEQTLTVTVGEASKKIRQVTSVASAMSKHGCLLITKDFLSSTDIFRITYNEENGEVAEEYASRTGKHNRIVFVTNTATILIDEYGMLETQYLQFMVEHQIEKLAEEKNLEAAITLAKKHGVGLDIITAPLLGLLQHTRIEGTLLLEIVKILFVTDNAQNTLCIEKIEQNVIDRIKETQSPTHTTPTTVQTRTIQVLSSVLVEIYLFRKTYGAIIALASQFASDPAVSPFSFALAEGHSASISILQRAIPIISKEEVLRHCLSQYAYTLCYIVLYITDSPFDETNEVLLSAGTDIIDSSNTLEELERRYRIAVVLKHRSKQVLYAIKKEIARMEKFSSREDEQTALAATAHALKSFFEKSYLRDFYIHLIKIEDMPPQEQAYAASSHAFKCLSSILLITSGDALVKENSLEEALLCYKAAGNPGKKPANALKIKLGLWEDLFGEPGTVTQATLQRIEGILLSKNDVLGAAQMHILHGDYPKGIDLLIKIEKYQNIFQLLQARPAANPASLFETLTHNLSQYAASIASMSQKHVEHVERLGLVRERKEREREEILNGVYADDDCETATLSKSFITNTFMSGTQSAKKKKRSSKLRNTVGGRYEEEYVQYVLSELIGKAQEHAVHAQEIERIVQNIPKEKLTPFLLQKHDSTVSLFNTALRQYRAAFLPSVETDFISQNNEEDVLYDPERPVITQPDTSLIDSYLQRIFP
ncbi:hypothetical protein NEDG_01601 [Nematocida displodere]|uniref:Elongator complex protein 1 n=1 Tax=Nematocida displodere TaxID=1805483 RepID=A0A177EH38_9MICR|nr:hypothetical protein NEDG_01601 [Nematocida displodere]